MRIDAERGVVFTSFGKPFVKRAGGYTVVRIAQGKYVPAHRVIWESVNGPIAAGMQINHVNGDKHDNRIANLEVVTPSENCLHAFRTGLTSAVGGRNGRARLNIELVMQIRASADSWRALARRFGVAKSTIQAVKQGTSWRSL
jgi:hypothetical protein